MITPSKTTRRPLKFKTTEEMNVELDHLQKANYKKLGKWSLPQACRHVAMTIEGSLEPAPSETPTPEETAMKQKFFGMVLNPEGIPENLPIGNPALIPGEDCTDTEIDRLKAAFEKLAKLPHKYVKVGRCGPVPVSELVEVHLAHAAHHISFLQPLTPSPMRKKPADYRQLSFADISAALTEIDRLQKNPYRQLGSWNLPTIAWHVTTTLGPPFKPAADPNPTPQQAQMQAGFLDVIIQTGKPPAGASPPIEVMPLTNCTDADVEKLKTTLRDLAAYPHSQAEMGPFGPVPIEKFRKVHLVHLAHHLGFLIPTTNN